MAAAVPEAADVAGRVAQWVLHSDGSHSDLGSAACPPSAEAGAGPVAERARADEFDAVGGACGEASEMAIAVLHGGHQVTATDKPEVDTLDDP